MPTSSNIQTTTKNAINAINIASTNPMKVNSKSTESSIQLTELSFKIIYTGSISEVLDCNNEKVRHNIQLQSVGSGNVDNQLDVDSVKSCVRRYTRRYPNDDQATRIFISKVCIACLCMMSL